MGRTALHLVFLVPAATCALWTLYAGKDVNWDLLNYHYYAPFQWITGRIEQDFFAASAQSYLNPLGYVPFYLLVSGGWHSVLVSVGLAAAHSVSIALLYLLAWKLFAHLPGRERAILSCLAAALGAATSVFWALVGTSFLDALLVPLMLAGLLLLLEGGAHYLSRALLAGMLFGVAAALKYSNAVFGVAALPLAIALPGVHSGLRLRACLAYVAGGVLAIGVLAGPWFFLMIREFGNPVFPLMNGWFQSPFAPPANLISERFAPTDLAAAVSFPFRMITLDSTVYSENFAPDLRFAALLAAAAALPMFGLRRNAPPLGGLQAADWRLLVFFSAGLMLWLASSANGRYGLILLLLAGVCLARLAERLLTQGAARVALTVLLGAQVGASIMASPARWYVAEPWSKHWLPYVVPERARQEPALYLTVEELPMAVVTPFFHPASSFVNFRGQYSIPTESPKLAALLARHGDRVRTFGRALRLVDGQPRREAVKAYDDTLLRIGYRVDPADCFAIDWRPDRDDPLSRAANWLAGNQASRPAMLSAGSCALREAKRDPADVESERRFSAVFDRIEKACPGLFRGQTAITEPLGGGWSRLYPIIEARLEAQGDTVILNRYRTMTFVHLGALTDWEGMKPSTPADCHR